MDFNAEVFAGFAESCVACLGKNPDRSVIKLTGLLSKDDLHLWLCDTSLRIRLIPGAQTGHQDGLCSSTGSHTC